MASANTFAEANALTRSPTPVRCNIASPSATFETSPLKKQAKVPAATRLQAKKKRSHPARSENSNDGSDENKDDDDEDDSSSGQDRRSKRTRTGSVGKKSNGAKGMGRTK